MEVTVEAMDDWDDDVRRDLPSASIVKAKYRADGTPEFDAADFKEMEARARGPDVLTPQEMAIVLEAKEEGNSKFKAGRVEEACQEYNCALKLYGDCLRLKWVNHFWGKRSWSGHIWLSQNCI